MNKITLILIGMILIWSCSEPSPGFSASYANGEENPTEIKFTNTSQHADSYMWYFGDGSTTTQKDPVHTFRAFGDVMVVLEAKKGVFRRWIPSMLIFLNHQEKK